MEGIAVFSIVTIFLTFFGIYSLDAENDPSGRYGEADLDRQNLPYAVMNFLGRVAFSIENKKYCGVPKPLLGENDTLFWNIHFAMDIVQHTQPRYIMVIS